MTVTVQTKGMTEEEALQEYKQVIREILHQWEELENDKRRRSFISAVRFYVSHDRWPRTKEGAQSFMHDYTETERPSITLLYNDVLACLRHRYTLSTPGTDLNSLRARLAREAMDSTIAKVMTRRHEPPPHPDYFRKWTDPRKRTRRGTKVWYSSGNPNTNALAELEGHERQGCSKAFKKIALQRKAEEAKKRVPTNKKKSAKQLREYFAQKKRQREESQRRRKALDAESKRLYEETLRRRRKDRGD